jgi:hypothetical protein
MLEGRFARSVGPAKLEPEEKFVCGCVDLKRKVT